MSDDLRQRAEREREKRHCGRRRPKWHLHTEHLSFFRGKDHEIKSLLPNFAYEHLKALRWDVRYAFSNYKVKMYIKDCSFITYSVAPEGILFARLPMKYLQHWKRGTPRQVWYANNFVEIQCPEMRTECLLVKLLFRIKEISLQGYYQTKDL